MVSVVQHAPGYVVVLELVAEAVVEATVVVVLVVVWAAAACLV
jgi:hypothetical protein